jgi:hypothetical protein
LLEIISTLACGEMFGEDVPIAFNWLLVDLPVWLQGGHYHRHLKGIRGNGFSS